MTKIRVGIKGYLSEIIVINKSFQKITFKDITKELGGNPLGEIQGWVKIK